MRSIVITLLKLAGAGVAFALLFHFVQFDKVSSVLHTAHLSWVVMGVLVFLAGQVVAAARWRRILRNGAIDIPLRSVWRMNLIGAFAGNFLPGMGSGDLVKSALLFRDYPTKKPFLVASVVYDRVSGLIVIAMLMLMGALLLGVGGGDWALIRYAVSAFLLIILSVWLLGSKIGLVHILPILPKSLATRLSFFIDELRRVLRTRSLVGPTLIFSLLFQLSWTISQWIMLCAVSEDAPFVPVLAASAFSLIVALLPISLNGLGVREGTYSFFLQYSGIDPQAAVAAALLSLLPILVTSLIGGVMLGWGGRYGRAAAATHPDREVLP